MAEKKGTRADVDQLIDDPVWDAEEKHELIEGPMGSVYDNKFRCNVALWSWMVREWGGVVSAVKTATNSATGEVTIGRAEPGEKGIVKVRTSPTMNAAEFSFWRPLKKLNLKVPSDRRLQVLPHTRQTKSGKIVFIFPMNDAKSLPRGTRGESSSTEVAAAQETE